MESDGKKHFVDLDSDDSSHDIDQEDNATEKCSDLEDNETANFNAGDTELKSMNNLSESDIMKMEFDSEENAWEFYKNYGRSAGFGVRKANVDRDVNYKIIRRYFVCNREGLREAKYKNLVGRKRQERAETRTNCGAIFSVYLDTVTSKWRVGRFKDKHNHSLTPMKHAHLIPSLREMTDADKAQFDSYQACGMSISQIMTLMADQVGGYSELRFVKKDLYNYSDKKRRSKIVNGDVTATISYLKGKEDSDPMMFFKRSLKDDGRLGNLFWADGLSRVDYEYFGDVLAFDTTYKKNQYDMPLVIFSGTNHHRQTCVFACALVTDERADTYKWVLEMFLEAMRNKQPSIVVTDGDEAMREAIKVVFPNARHRLCAWHLHKNATSNIKDTEFCQEFKKFIYANIDPDEFEENWQNMIQKFDVVDNNWVKKTYEKKAMWARAYLRDKFYAGVRTTSQCEGINAFIQKYIKWKHPIVEVVQQFERAVKDYRNNELVADFKSSYSSPVPTTTLKSIERGAANVYTREIFEKVKKEINKHAELFVIDFERVSTTVVYKLNTFGKPGRVVKVMYDRNSKKFDCQCCLLVTHGIPCRHIFLIMKHEQILELPENMILKRWTKVAKSYDEHVVEQEEDTEKQFVLRFGALAAASMRMSFLGAKSKEKFLSTREKVSMITSSLEDTNSKMETESSSVPKDNVGDPAVVKTKGAPPARKRAKMENGSSSVPKKERRCSNCNMTGHTRRSCIGLKGKESQLRNEVSSSPTSKEDPNNVPRTNKEVEHNSIDPMTRTKSSQVVMDEASVHGTRSNPQLYPLNKGEPGLATNVPGTNKEVQHNSIDPMTRTNSSHVVMDEAPARGTRSNPQFHPLDKGEPSLAAIVPETNKEVQHNSIDPMARTNSSHVVIDETLARGTQSNPQLHPLNKGEPSLAANVGQNYYVVRHSVPYPNAPVYQVYGRPEGLFQQFLVPPSVGHHQYVTDPMQRPPGTAQHHLIQQPSSSAQHHLIRQPKSLSK